MKLAEPSIKEKEKKYVADALSRGDISQGDYLPRFEELWAKINGYGFGVACNSGTSAMFLALKALEIGEGDEVIVPEFTMASTAWAVSYTGAQPVFVDCTDNLLMDLNKITKAITKKTRAIMPVHIYGRNANTIAIKGLTKKYGLVVIEDMAEAHGIRPHGDVACYSFQANKILSTGEGGMCLTNYRNLSEEIRKLSTLYFDKERSLIHQKIGYNMKMTNVAAAIGCAQVERITEILIKRKEIESWYDQRLSEEMVMPKREVLWMYDVNVGKNQEKIKKILESRRIPSRYFFKPMSQQPMYLKPYHHLNAYEWSKKGLYLPTYTDMTKSDVDEVCDQLLDVQKILG